MALQPKLEDFFFKKTRVNIVLFVFLVSLLTLSLNHAALAGNDVCQVAALIVNSHVFGNMTLYFKLVV